jgi:crotonobetaine/carnitine-CoA ligase
MRPASVDGTGEEVRVLTVMPGLGERNLEAVLRTGAAEYPDRLAVRDRQAAFSYGELWEDCLRVAGGFAALGVGRQDPVLLMLDNHIDFVRVWLGLVGGGGVEVPVNTAYLGSILSYVINQSGARVMVVEDRYLPRLLDVASDLVGLETVVVRGRAPDGPLAWRTVALDEVLAGRAIDPVHLDPWDLHGIMYTSGTTGPSKGVRVTHAHAYGYASPSAYGVATADDVAVVALPLFHIGGQWAGVYNALIAGGSAAVLDGFSASKFWDDIRAYGCTVGLLLGAMADFLIRQPQRLDDADNPFRVAVVVPLGAEPQVFAERFGVQVCTAYGSTEASAVIASGLERVVPRSCGIIRDGFDARLVDVNDLEVPVGQVGELVVRSREPWMLMDGYHQMPDATVRAWRNLWFHTGDAFYRDESGTFFFVDRLKDAIRRRGENVSSFEVEAEISHHPAVAECAVVGVESEHSEQEIKASVVLQPGAELSGEDLIGFLTGRLPYFMIPRYIEFRDELPKTPTQKIRKEALRAAGTEGNFDAVAAGVAPARDTAR